MQSAEWYWRDDVQFASKPWQAVHIYNGRILEKRNFKKEVQAREYAEAWSFDARRTGRLS